MINKRRFSIKNTKKVLHKVGKHWVVVSALLLGLVAGGTAVTTQANASANTSVGTEATAPANMNSAQIANYKGKIQYYRNKGIMNDALNGVGNHIKPKMASSADSTAYSNAVNMVRPASLAKLSAGSGEQLGTVTDPSSNTWFGSLSYAENQAKTFTNNDSKYQKALGILNSELNNTKLPSSVTLNSISKDTLNDMAKGQDYSSLISSKLDSILGVPYANKMVDSKLQSLASTLKSSIVPSQFASSVPNPTIARKGNASVSFSVENPNVKVSITSPSVYNFKNPVHVLINNGQPLTVANAINSDIKLTIPSNITVSGLGGNLSINNATIIPKGTVNIKISDTVPKLIGSGTKKITKYSTLYINESVPKTDTNPLDRPIHTNPINIDHNNIKKQTKYGLVTLQIPSAISNQTFTSKHSLSTTINLSNRSYTSQRVADILADTPAVQSDAIDSMISSQIKSHAEALLPTKADSYISDAVDVISAGNEMLKNPNMESVYSNAVNNIANLPNDNESGEYADLNSAAKNANALSTSYSTATTSNSRAGSVFTRAANAATSAATSMSNAMNTINTDSTNVSSDVNSVAIYSGNLNNDIDLSGKPVSANASALMSGDYTDVKHDNTIASNAQSAYSDWADTDDAFNVTNANNASANASTTADNAKGLVNVEFSASFNYMNGSKSVGNGTFSTTVSNPSSVLSKTPTSTVTNMPAGYKLSNGANDVITLNGTTQSIEVVSASPAQPTNNKVTEYIHFNGDSASNTSSTGSAGTTGYVSAPSNYHFTSGSATKASFTFSSNGTATFSVASNTVTETIHFNGDGNASSVVSGTYDQPGSVSAPSGYTFSNSSTEAYFSYATSNSSMNMKVYAKSASNNSNNSNSGNSKATSVIDTAFFNGYKNANGSASSSAVSGSINTNATLSAPANYHFTSSDGYKLTSNASDATFNLGSSNHNIELYVASNKPSSTNSNSSSASSSAQSSSNSKSSSAPSNTSSKPSSAVKPSNTNSKQSSAPSSASSSASSAPSNSAQSSNSASSGTPASSSANNMPFIPSVPSFNNGSMASTNASASAEPNSMSTNTSNSSAEPKAHVANYVTVEKALQLHISPNFTKNNRVMTVEPGTRLDLEKTVRARHGLVRYEVNYKGKNYFVTANKKFTTHFSYELTKPSHYRYFKVGKALQLHTSPYFTKKNGVMTVKPGAEFRINRVVKAHGLVRYEVSYKGSVYFVTANKDFSANAYLQKSNFGKRGHKAVRVIKKLSEYKKLSFAKHSLIRNFRKGSVLPVKRVITIANGEMTRLQLTNGRYVSANKDFVKVIK